MHITVMATFFQKHQAFHHTANRKGTIVLFLFIVVQQSFCSFEKKRLTQKFVHVLYCPIKISILFNGLCVWIMFSFIGIEFAHD